MGVRGETAGKSTEALGKNMRGVWGSKHILTIFMKLLKNFNYF